ncbi:MAG: TAT-variant-translocated molybdopterin oxidoreductase, partial [Phycisphaerales bacterium]
MHDGCTHGHAEPAPAPVPATQAGGPARRSAYWRSVEQLAATPEFQSFMHREFQPGAAEVSDDDRRSFIKVMGASFALAGLAAAGCRRYPEAKFAEYASRPANRSPGIPVTYASTYELAGTGFGVLATTFDGRPIKLDGNPAHPSAPLAGGAAAVDPAALAARGVAQVGPSSAIGQARVLELYDPERSRIALEGGKPSTAAAFDAWLEPRRAEWKRSGGAGLVVVAEPSASPTMADVRARLLAAFPKATWASWCSVNEDNALAGTKLAFGAPRAVRPRFDRAKVILSLDSDFLNECRSSVETARAWAAGRTLMRRENGRLVAKDAAKAEMSRVYQVEGLLTVTGMSADQRIAVRPSQVAALAAAVADRLGVGGARQMAAFAPKLGDHDQEILDALVEDLKSAGSAGVVVAGNRQPPVVHAIAAAINAHLGAYGTTVETMSTDAEPCGPSLEKAVAMLNAGNVDTLVVVGCNPAFDAPADLGFAAAMAKAKHVVHLAYRVDET